MKPSNISGSQHSQNPKKHKKPTETRRMVTDWQKIQGCDYKAQKGQKREIELVNKELWKKIK